MDPCIAAAAVVVLGLQATPPDPRSGKTEHSVRLYVMDCGALHIADMGPLQLRKEDLATTDLSVACYLVVNPKGTLIWDTGAVPDYAWAEIEMLRRLESIGAIAVF